MRVTEQIDAIECLGTNPIQYLVVPRFIGIMISSVILLVIGLIVSVVGAMLVAIAPLRGQSAAVRLEHSAVHRRSGRSVGGMFQSLVYGVIVGVRRLLQWLHGFGRRARSRAAQSLWPRFTRIFYIVIANFLSSEFLEWIGEVGRYGWEWLTEWAMNDAAICGASNSRRFADIFSLFGGID